MELECTSSVMNRFQGEHTHMRTYTHAHTHTHTHAHFLHKLFSESEVSR
uniref:Uncharacterized protein n=1 Tax=Anguilla anguilla TaxID=7936 RepID=A0A0E9WJM6_ANGAN